MTSSTNFLELRVFGLQRSGNHAVIEWILDQHQDKRTCFLNNVRHGDHDPYKTAEKMTLSGFGALSDAETVRITPKDVLIYSYEDDVSRLQGRQFIAGIDDAQFEKNRMRYVGVSQYRMNIVILRDPFNFFASRLKKLNRLTGVKDLDIIKQDWKLLAKRALQMSNAGVSEGICVNYNRWFTAEKYRRRLSRALMGKFSDASLNHVPSYGGGSSFDATVYAQLDLRIIRRKWRRLFDPKVYLNPRRYLHKFFAKGARRMKVLERWQELQNDPSYRRIFRDRELLDLSERLFGEMGGTREFVNGCAAEEFNHPDTGNEACPSARR